MRVDGRLLLEEGYKIDAEFEKAIYKQTKLWAELSSEWISIWGQEQKKESWMVVCTISGRIGTDWTKTPLKQAQCANWTPKSGFCRTLIWIIFRARLRLKERFSLAKPLALHYPGLINVTGFSIFEEQWNCGKEIKVNPGKNGSARRKHF